MVYLAKSTCRTCMALCPINVTIDDGRVVKVEGNPDAPLYGGFICPKGRALAAGHNDPDRLLHSLKRMPDGSYRAITSEQLVEEISDKLKTILEKQGPQSIAAYLGGPGLEHQAAMGMMRSFLGTIGSDRFFNPSSIDQPGCVFSEALHGTWAGGRIRPEKLEVFLLVGSNPIISKQYFSQNPAQQLKRLVANGMKLIVIDPRRTETARRAHIHLQCIPGEDPTIMAGLIHLVIKNGKVNSAFVDQNTVGLEKLSAAVALFTPEYVAERAGINEQDLCEAARIIGDARLGDFGSGIGPAMATRGTLTSYLIRCLQTLRGFWAAAGDEAVHPRVLQPRHRFNAQPINPRPAWGFGKTMRIRGLQQTTAGMPLGALPGEILTPGEGQIRALFLHGGAMHTWPQTAFVKKALESLDLLVLHDVTFSATSRLASYVIATRKAFEMPSTTLFSEQAGTLHNGYGWVDPYAAYQPALLDPPEGSDLLDAWQIYYLVSQKLGLKLNCSGFPAGPGTLFDMTRMPSTEDLYELMCHNSAIPLAEVKKYPDGKIFDEAREVVAPRATDCTARLDLANPEMLEELKCVRAESVAKRRGIDQNFPFLYIPRRMHNTINGAYRPKGLLKTPYNPAYLHSSDLATLGLKPGDKVEIRSRHGAIVGFVDIDDDLRPGVLSMCHGFGRNPGEASDPRQDGANVNWLIHWEDDYDRYHGMPRMSALPVAIKAAA